MPDFESWNVGNPGVKSGGRSGRRDANTHAQTHTQRNTYRHKHRQFVDVVSDQNYRFRFYYFVIIWDLNNYVLCLLVLWFGNFISTKKVTVRTSWSCECVKLHRSKEGFFTSSSASSSGPYDWERAQIKTLHPYVWQLCWHLNLVY